MDGTTNVITRMNFDALYVGYRNMMEYIYAPINYYMRVRTFLREYKAPIIKTRQSPVRIMAFVRSLVQLGIVGRERMHYWKLLIWTTIRRRELLPLAVTLAIHGFHFRKTVQQHIH